MPKVLLILVGLVFCTLAGRAAPLQPIYYNASSATQSENTLDSVTTNGSSLTTLFTATGPGMNNVSRCTSVAVDGLNGKLFMVDGASNSLWRFNLDGTGPTLIETGLTSYPTDLALDVLNQKIYYTTSSTITNNNTVQRIDYSGNNNAVLFIATGASGNGVSRCTAIALDVSNSKIFLADAGTKRIWSLSLAGTGLTPLTAAADSTPTGLAVNPTSQQVYFTLSSPLQKSNFVQRVNYNGSGLTTIFTAVNSVQRCTALDLDPAHGAIYLSDAGANVLWRIPINGGSATTVLGGLTATAKKVRWYGGPATRPPPGITGIYAAGPSVVLNATNGYLGGTYYLLTSTNVGTPLPLWLPVATNVLGSSGSFSITDTKALGASAPRQFYILQVK